MIRRNWPGGCVRHVVAAKCAPARRGIAERSIGICELFRPSLRTDRGDLKEACVLSMGVRACNHRTNQGVNQVSQLGNPGVGAPILRRNSRIISLSRPHRSDPPVPQRKPN